MSTLQEYRVTFGQRYGREGEPPHPTLPEAHRDGWLTVLAPDADGARALVVEAIGIHWADLYPADSQTPEQWADWYPRGELARLPRQSWPCCVHCDEDRVPPCTSSPHYQPCQELIAYPGTGDPRPQPCQ